MNHRSLTHALPSASDGGCDNTTSVAAAAVWMRMLAGMLPPKMLSTRRPSCRPRCSSSSARPTRSFGPAQTVSAPQQALDLAQTRVRRACPPSPLAAPAARQGQLRRVHRRNHQKFFQLNNWAAHACFALSYSGLLAVHGCADRSGLEACRSRAVTRLSTGSPRSSPGSLPALLDLGALLHLRQHTSTGARSQPAHGGSE